MKLAHLADLHLGFRQYHRQTPSGINQREADVALAFRRAIDDIAASKPDIVLMAGDVFHSVRPTNAAIVDAFNQLTRLRQTLPDVPLVIVAGNHDTPRSVETGSILKLFESIDGIHVAHQEPRRFAFERLGLTVLGVPTPAWSGEERAALEPDPNSKYNVLVTHREVDGVIPADSGLREYGMAPIDVRELHADRFDYVALGHYHVAHAVTPNTWYSGSLEYVSSNPWGELATEAAGASAKSAKGAKGWLSVDLAAGARPAVTLHTLPLARRHMDLVPIKGEHATAEDLDRLIAERVADIAGGIADQVVRQLVYDVPRLVARDMNHEQIRKLKAGALHYLLDLRRPRTALPIGVSKPGARQTLGDTVADYLGRRPLDAGMNRERLVGLGRQYMSEVERDLAEQ